MAFFNRLDEGDVVRVFTHDELIERNIYNNEGNMTVDGLIWVPGVMNCVFGEEVVVKRIFTGPDAYSTRKSDAGYYEFSVDKLPPSYHLNPSMLHTTRSIEIPDISENDWASVVFG